MLLGALAGCAPAQSFRPAGALAPGRRSELGIALASVGPRPYVRERARPVAQGWWSSRLGERWLSSVLVGFDASALLAGTALRLDLVQRRFSASAEAELGWAWAALSVPLALRPWPELAVYCAPRLGNWGPELTAFLPCGLDTRVWQGLAVRGELQLSWAGFEYYNRRLHVGLGVAQQW